MKTGRKSPYFGSPSKRSKPIDPEVLTKVLPDHVKPGLSILFIGINPGVLSASKGHHYAGPTNHFWPCLSESGLVPDEMTYKDDSRCLDYGIGFTNIVARTTPGAADLSKEEIRRGGESLKEKVQELKPQIACFNGKGIYEIFSGKTCSLGRQPEFFPGTKDTVVFVMPSSSARAVTYPRASDKLPFFEQLKEIRDSFTKKTD